MGSNQSIAKQSNAKESNDRIGMGSYFSQQRGSRLEVVCIECDPVSPTSSNSTFVSIVSNTTCFNMIQPCDDENFIYTRFDNAESVVNPPLRRQESGSKTRNGQSQQFDPSSKLMNIVEAMFQVGR